MPKKPRPAGTVSNIVKEVLKKDSKLSNTEVAAQVCKKLGIKVKPMVVSGSRMKKIRAELGIKTLNKPVQKMTSKVIGKVVPLKEAGVYSLSSIEKRVDRIERQMASLLSVIAKELSKPQ